MKCGKALLKGMEIADHYADMGRWTHINVGDLAVVVQAGEFMEDGQHDRALVSCVISERRDGTLAIDQHIHPE